MWTKTSTLPSKSCSSSSSSNQFKAPGSPSSPSITSPPSWPCFVAAFKRSARESRASFRTLSKPWHLCRCLTSSLLSNSSCLCQKVRLHRHHPSHSKTSTASTGVKSWADPSWKVHSRQSMCSPASMISLILRRHSFSQRSSKSRSARPSTISSLRSRKLSTIRDSKIRTWIRLCLSNSNCQRSNSSSQLWTKTYLRSRMTHFRSSRKKSLYRNRQSQLRKMKQNKLQS